MSKQGNMVVALIEECGDGGLLPADVRRAASLLVCANAAGATDNDRVADAKDLLGALGLLPGQEPEWTPGVLSSFGTTPIT